MDALKTAQKIVDESFIGTMATIKDNKPHSRYMTFFNEGFTLYTATSKKTEKVEEVEHNPSTHILIGYDGQGFGDAYLEFMGKAIVSTDESLKKTVWNENLEPWFDGPEDPNLVILKIEPVAIRLMNKKGQAPQEIKF